MVRTAFVKIWGDIAGAVAWNEDTQLASFEYDPKFIQKQRELAPLTMPLPNGKRIYSFPELRSNSTFKGLPGLLADVLPDRYGNQLINAWLAQNGRPANSLNPVELLCFVGTRGMGALEFEPAQFSNRKNTFPVELDSLVEITAKILDERQDFKTKLNLNEQEALRDILRIGTSAGGARPKAIIAYNQKTGEVRSGQAHIPKGFGHWLIKLDGVSEIQFGESNGYGRVEMAYYYMATDCGIEMQESQLLEENGRAHFMTRRFDRSEEGDKFHIQTFCAMRHFDYNNVSSYSYEQLFETMRMLRLPYPQAEQMFRRMTFNVLSRNCDDHTKNFAFRLKEKGEWELAPAYDICHAYRPDSPWVSQHALSVNGKRQGINRTDLMTIARSMHIKKASIIIDQIAEVVKKWLDYADRTGVETKLRDAIGNTLPAARAK